MTSVVSVLAPIASIARAEPAHGGTVDPSAAEGCRQQWQRPGKGAGEAAVARVRRSCNHGERYDAMADVAGSADGWGTRKIRTAFRAGKQ